MSPSGPGGGGSLTPVTAPHTPHKSPPPLGSASAATGKLEKPRETYSTLIARAILASPGRMARLSTIYRWISDHYPYFQTKESQGWQNSVRHNLSLNKSFIRIPADHFSNGGGKGDYWTIHSAHLEKFSHLLPGNAHNALVPPRPLVAYHGGMELTPKYKSAYPGYVFPISPGYLSTPGGGMPPPLGRPSMADSYARFLNGNGSGGGSVGGSPLPSMAGPLPSLTLPPMSGGSPSLNRRHYRSPRFFNSAASGETNPAGSCPTLPYTMDAMATPAKTHPGLSHGVRRFQLHTPPAMPSLKETLPLSPTGSIRSNPETVISDTSDDWSEHQSLCKRAKVDHHHTSDDETDSNFVSPTLKGSQLPTSQGDLLTYNSVRSEEFTRRTPSSPPAHSSVLDIKNLLN